MNKNNNDKWKDAFKNEFHKNNKDQIKKLILGYINMNIKVYDSIIKKDELFSIFISSLQNIIFDGGDLTEKLKHYMDPIFWIQEVIMDYINHHYSINFIPSAFFKLLNSLFELYKTLDSERKKKFLEKIEELFGRNKSDIFILKFFNDLFEILTYSKIDQNKNVREQGKKLGLFLEESLTDNVWKYNNIFDFEKFEKILLEKINANQPILTEFISEWINIIIFLSSRSDFLWKIFIDLMPWIIKTKNSGDAGDNDVIIKCDENMKKNFLNYLEDNIIYNITDNFAQIKNCILSFIKLVREQKEINQPKEYEFLKGIIKKLFSNDKINIKVIFPFETLNNFLLLILQSKDISLNLNELNNNLKTLIEKKEYKDFKKEEFKETIEKGINNPNFVQKVNAIDWYILMYKKNKEIIKEEESNKDIINIILKTIGKNIEDEDNEDNENLFLLMIDKLYKNKIISLFDLLSDCILSEKSSYIFKYKIAGYLNNFLIFSSRAKEFKQYFITPINKKETGDLSLFEKLYKIFSFNPICLLLFCIYIELYELGWELILKFKNIKLEDDYYKYLAIFVQAIDNKQWNDLRMKFLLPNKNIYFVKCLYGILMLLPQGKAFDILSDRLYSIKGLFKCKNYFDNYKKDKEENIVDKNYIDKYIDLFSKIQEENKKDS